MTTRLRVLLGVGAVLALAAGPVLWGQVELPRLEALRLAAPVVLDGRLDEACWATAPSASEFRALAAGKHAPQTPEPTQCQVVFDDEALVLAVVCHEPRMGDLIAEAAERDGAIWLDDSVEIFLVHGTAHYYQFGINSRGTLYDARVAIQPDGTGGDLATGRLWDGAWEAVVRREADRWTIEARIPFATLDLTPRTPSEWRFSVGRTAARRREYSSWSPVVKGFHDLPRFGTLAGLDVDFRRFVIDGTALEMPALRVGRNAIRLAMPVLPEAGPFLVSSALRPWSAEAGAMAFPAGRTVAAVDGVLSVDVELTVLQGKVLHEAGLQILDAASGRAVLQRRHLFRAPEPFVAALPWAVLYPSDGTAEVAVDLAVTPESAHGRLRATLLGAAGLTREVAVAVDHPGSWRLSLPLADLPGGYYRVAVIGELADLGRCEAELRFLLTPGPFD
ncbi:MAG: carbohydrate binding family 9 domain-containing protein [Lentisphaerae bacterium]|nr:carbohydrate binding family 9 domain-containing protein [Lentisphaerota bacterium]